MSVARRRPNYWPRLSTGLAIDRSLSVPGKYVAAIAAGLRGRDPGIRQLEAALPFEQRTILRAIGELEGSGLARIDRRRGRRSIVHPAGLALPGKVGRHNYAIIPSGVFYAAIDAGSGRNAAYGPLVVQRLLREQAKREGAAHVSPAVLAADLGINLRLVRAILDWLERGAVVERHRHLAIDSDEFHVYTVPGGEPVYPIGTDGLDEAQTRILETIELGEHRLTVLGRRIDLDALDHRIVAVRAELPDEEIARIVGGLVAGNLTGATILAGDFLDGLRPTPIAASPDTDPSLGPTPEAACPDTSISNVGSVSHVETRYEDEENKDADYARAQAAAPARAEELSGEEERVHRAPAATARAKAQRFEAPYCPSVGYTATAATHERITALLDAVAAARGDVDAHQAAYRAVTFATADFTRGAKGSNVLACLKLQYGRYDPEQRDAGLDFGKFAVAGE